MNPRGRIDHASLTGGTLVGVLGGDTVSLTQTGTYASKNVGSGIPVTATDALSGTSAGDYSITQPVGLTGTITPASLTVSGTTVANSVYNGTTAASLTGGTLVGVVGGDTVSLTQAGTFASRNVGSGIPVSASDSLSGASASDYSITQPIGLTGTITAASLTVSGTTVANSVYNGTTAASLTGGTLVGVVGGDTVSLTQAGMFASKNAGSGIPVTATDTLSGTSAGDYSITQPIGLTGTITPASLTVSGTTVTNSVYNGTTAASLTGGTLVGVVGGDTVSLTQTGTYASKNVGSGIPVTATDTLSGTSASDYSITQPIGLTGTITPASLTVRGTTVANSVYNGTTAASLTGGTLVGVVGGDTVSLTQAGMFASKNAGTGIPVTAADALSGTSAADYSITQPIRLTGTITPASLTVSGTTVANSVYNGTTAASLTGGTLVGVLGGDTVSLTQAGMFASKNVGSGIPVTATDTLSGASAGDYSITQPMGLTGTITPASLTVSGTTVGAKVYNGTNAAPLAGGSLVGVVGGDTVTLNQSGLFASTSAGIGISVTATDTLSGASAGDYSIVEPTGLTGSILPAATQPPNDSNALVLAALNASTQIVENFVYPQLGANPRVIDPSPTIAVLETPAESRSEQATDYQQAITVNVSMKIGANGTLKIENGGLRLPSNLVIDNE